MYQKYENSNLGQGQLQAGISANDTSLILQAGQGGLFPTSNFLMKLEKLDMTSVFEIKPVVKREIVLCTNRIGDTFTLVRGYGLCPASDSATTQTQTQFSFDMDDYCVQVLTTEQIEDIQDEVSRLELDKLDIADYITGAKLFKDSETGTDAYQVSIPEITSYAQVDGQIIRVRVDTTNSGDATFEINNLGPKIIMKFQDEQLQTGDVQAGQIILLVYNLDSDDFEIKEAIDQRGQAIVDKETVDVVLGENITVDDLKGAVFYGNGIIDVYSGGADQWIFGNMVGYEKIGFQYLSTNGVIKTLTVKFEKIGVPADNINVVIQGLLNVGTTLTIPNALIGTDIDLGALYKTTYNEYMCTAMAGISIVFNRVGALSLTDFYKGIGYRVNQSYSWTNFSSPGLNTGVWTTLATYTVGLDVEFFEKWSASMNISVDGPGYWRIQRIRGLSTTTIYTAPVGCLTPAFANFSYSFYDQWIKGDQFVLQGYNQSGNSRSITMNNMLLGIYRDVSNGTFQDGLDRNKVWQSYTYFSPMNKCDGILTQSGLAEETKTMQTTGLLLQTNAVINGKYYLNSEIVLKYNLLAKVYDGKYTTNLSSSIADMYMRDDGKKIYTMISTNIQSYLLTTPYDITTVVYENKVLSVNAQETSPDGFYLSRNGTRLFIVGTGSDRVKSYTLTIPWDINTAVYDNKSFDPTPQAINPIKVQFNTSLSKMYVIGTADVVYQYDLGTAGDITTAVYSGKSKSVLAQQSSLQGFQFSEDGKYFAVSGSSPDGVFRYDMSTPWDLSTAVYNTNRMNTVGQYTLIRSFTFAKGGEKIYVLCNQSQWRVYQYTITSVAPGGYGTFGLIKPTTSTEFLIGKGDTDTKIMLMINEQNSFTSKEVGVDDFINLSQNVIYQATTSGFLVAWVDASSNNNAQVFAYADAVNATTYAGQCMSNNSVGVNPPVVVPIKKGWFYKLIETASGVDARSYRFYPLKIA